MITDLKTAMVERTWLNKSEAEVILSVVADCVKRNHPKLIYAIDSILQIEKPESILDLPIYNTKKYQPGTELY